MLRDPVIDRFPKAPGLPRNIAAYRKRVNDAYVTDAYHSLSIEGYRVTRELMERVRSATWNPETDVGDREQRNALTARGYCSAARESRSRRGRDREEKDDGVLSKRRPPSAHATDGDREPRHIFGPQLNG
jgi:hypothetical protein